MKKIVVILSYMVFVVIANFWPAFVFAVPQGWLGLTKEGRTISYIDDIYSGESVYQDALLATEKTFISFNKDGALAIGSALKDQETFGDRTLQYGDLLVRGDLILEGSLRMDSNTPLACNDMQKEMDSLRQRVQKLEKQIALLSW